VGQAYPHPYSTRDPFTGLPKLLGYVGRRKSLKNGRYPLSQFCNCGGRWWMQGPALGSSSCSSTCRRSNTSCCVMGIYSRPPVDTTGGETLCQAARRQRRRVEVLRIAHRSTRAGTRKKRLEIPSRYGLIKLHDFFLPAAVCSYSSSHVPMYEPGSMVRVQSDVQVRSAFLTWRLFWLRRVGLRQRREKSTATNVSNVNAEVRLIFEGRFRDLPTVIVPC
jgi:hypothetical protein